MKLDTRLITEWPKLAWVAQIPPAARQVMVLHGPCVETADRWCVEAVWAGRFGEGDFDRTDLVFGSGVRLRGDEVVFVSSGTTLDRLWHCSLEGFVYVANSLPALLAVTGITLRDDYLDYARDIDTICRGLGDYARSIPANGGSVSPVYFNNLRYDGNALREETKADTAPQFNTFATYHAYLVDTACKLGKNMDDPARLHKISPLTTVSQGYDSSAVAAISRHCGCRQAVTIRQSTSLWRGSDSGARIAKQLGLECRTYSRTARRYTHEETIWAVAGRCGILNWTLFDYPDPLCLFFTGSYGDKVWNRSHRDYGSPFVGTSLSHGGLGEFRLLKGVFHCTVPFWGMRHYRRLQEVSFLEEMEPWTLHNSYDRPIARRIVEQAGVPRTAFGRRKKNTSHEAVFLWPHSPEARQSFRRFLAGRGMRVPSEIALRIRGAAASLDMLVYANIVRRFGWRDLGLRQHVQRNTKPLLFHWSNHELTEMYRRGLAGVQSSSKADNAGRPGP